MWPSLSYDRSILHLVSEKNKLFLIVTYSVIGRISTLWAMPYFCGYGIVSIIWAIVMSTYMSLFELLSWVPICHLSYNCVLIFYTSSSKPLSHLQEQTEQKRSLCVLYKICGFFWVVHEKSNMASNTGHSLSLTHLEIVN